MLPFHILFLLEYITLCTEAQITVTQWAEFSNPHGVEHCPEGYGSKGGARDEWDKAQNQDFNPLYPIAMSFAEPVEEDKVLLRKGYITRGIENTHAVEAPLRNKWKCHDAYFNSRINGERKQVCCRLVLILLFPFIISLCYSIAFIRITPLCF